MDDEQLINEAMEQILEQEYTMTPEEQAEYDRIMADSIPTNIVVDTIPSNNNENKD